MPEKLKGKEKGLDTKQKVFCIEYLQDFNATQAAIRAGYSKKTARSIGCENLTKPDIQKEISDIMNKQLGAGKQALELRIFQFWMKRAFYDITEIIDLNGNLKPEKEIKEKGLWTCIDGITKRVNSQGTVTMNYEFADKDKAVDMLQRYIQMIKDQPVTIKTDSNLVDLFNVIKQIKDPEDKERICTELARITAE